MAKKRAKSGRRKKRASSKQPDMILLAAKAVGALSLLLLLVVSAGLLARHFIKHPPAVQPQVVHRQVPPPAPARAPKYEVFSKKSVPPPKPLKKMAQLPGDQAPMVAIVVDDIGYDRQTVQQLMSLDAPLTFSVLPHGPHSRELASAARSRGHEIMLHLPMEPSEFPQINPGPGALLLQMKPDELIHTLNENLDRIPGLKGVNNHMGSGISSSPERMRQIFTALKKRGLYYIDSRTTADTVARPSAELLQIRFAERDIFIDHLEEEKFIRRQLKALIKRARQQGYAVGIAHPHAITYRVLADFLPQLKQAVELVPASMVVEADMHARLNGTRAAR